MPEASDTAGNARTVDLVGEFLERDLITPLGKAADLARAGLPVPLHHRGPDCQTFGMYRIAFPHRALVEGVARRLCQRLTEHWMTKDSKPLKETVHCWVEQQWVDQGLGAEAFIERLQQAAEKALGQSADSAFAALLEPLGIRPTPPGAKSPAMAARELVPAEVREVVAQLEQIIGAPEIIGATPEPGLLPDILARAGDAVGADLGQRLARLIVSLIEQPEYRLAGAEEAIRQTTPMIEKMLEVHETLGAELTTRAAHAAQQIRKLIAALEGLAVGGKKAAAPATASADLRELLRWYPKWRYQSLILRELTQVYVSLRGNLSDQLREINFCRSRLGELQKMFEHGVSEPGAAAGEPKAEPLGASARPMNCYCLPGAVR